MTLGDIGNRERFLRIIEIFERETDINHQVTYQDIINKLKREYDNYDPGIRAVRDDVNTIRSKFDIIIEEDKGQKRFSMQNRLFETYELRILIDAVYSARFITLKDKKKLIDKIKKLTSQYEASKLVNKLYVKNREICEDSSIKYTIDKLHTAVHERRKFFFKYGRYNVQKGFVLSDNGEYYEVEPYGVVWNDGFYYLVAKNIKKDEIVNYRIDRIRLDNKCDYLNNNASKFEKDPNFNMEDHLSQCFNMYPGKVYTLRIRFQNGLINAIIDRFGKGVNIVDKDETTFTIQIEAAVTKGLIRWILNWGSDAKVLEPNHVIDEVKEELLKAYNIY